MKALCSTLTLLACTVVLNAQIPVPNGDFEAWIGNSPSFWIVNNAETAGLTPVTKSTEANSGSYAVRGEVVDDPFSSEVIGPTLQSNAIGTAGQSPAAMLGYYQFSPSASTNSLFIHCTAQDANGQATGFGTLQLTGEQSSYSAFTVPIDYSQGSSEPTAGVFISITMVDDNGIPELGTYYLIDDLTYDWTTDLGEITTSAAVELQEIYPSPFNESVHIPFSLKQAMHLHIAVYDSEGRMIEVLSNEAYSAGEESLIWTPDHNVPSGNYLISVTAPGYTSVRQVALVR